MRSVAFGGVITRLGNHLYTQRRGTSYGVELCEPAVWRIGEGLTSPWHFRSRACSGHEGATSSTHCGRSHLLLPGYCGSYPQSSETAVARRPSSSSPSPFLVNVDDVLPPMMVSATCVPLFTPKVLHNFAHMHLNHSLRWVELAQELEHFGRDAIHFEGQFIAPLPLPRRATS
jgi:hypothetical protein